MIELANDNGQTAAGDAQPIDAIMQTVQTSLGDAEMEVHLPIMVAVNSAAHSGGVCHTLELWGPACLDCTHLSAEGEVEYKKCHFTQGNTACPAAYVKFVFVGARVKWTNKIAKIEAMEKGPDRINQKMNLIDQAREIDDDDLRQYVMSKLGID